MKEQDSDEPALTITFVVAMLVILAVILTLDWKHKDMRWQMMQFEMFIWAVSSLLGYCLVKTIKEMRSR